METKQLFLQTVEIAATAVSGIADEGLRCSTFICHLTGIVEGSGERELARILWSVLQPGKPYQHEGEPIHGPGGLAVGPASTTGQASTTD